ncbi:MAG: electron transport complex subunit RsxC [Granulosicoccaceae bacterium]|jgi:electron transport complex protein RnfC
MIFADFRLFNIRGGVHPASRKEATTSLLIKTLPMPERLYIPLQQHIGAPAEPVVRRGDRVLKGQLLAQNQGLISAPVHAPTSGTILKIAKHPAPHPSGLPVRTIILEADGKDEWLPLPEPVDPFSLSSAEIADKVAAAGIVGMGGATFPSAVKLGLGERYDLHTLVINGSECEPYLTCDDRLMQEQAESIVEGIRIMMHALKTERAQIAIESNKPEALNQMRRFTARWPGIAVIPVPTQYPMGSEKHLVQTLTGKETPAGKLSADIGVVVHNVATAHAVYHAVRYHKPLISRVVTVSGDAVNKPANLLVPIGTPVSVLFEACAGTTEEPARLLSGGPMMGQPLPDISVPIVKGTGAVLALSREEVNSQPAMPCIRCASCVEACPCGLLPLEMAARARKGDLDGASRIGLMDCISCGSCSYVCPSHIPLVQYFNHAKGAARQQQIDKRKQEEIKLLTAARSERLERQKQAKREAMARRKAEAEAKKQAKQKSKAEA